MASQVERLSGYRLADVPMALIDAGRPLVFSGAVNHWPLVGVVDAHALHAALAPHYGGRPFVTYRAPEGSKGRYGYAEGLQALNFEKMPLTLDAFFSALADFSEGRSQHSVFAPSVHLDSFFPGLSEAVCDALPQLPQALTQAWVGGPSVIPAHFDSQRNFACCLVGKRRFTLYPPDQLDNLYVGPLDLTPAGQAVSLVDSANPKPDQYPRFPNAEKNAWQAELAPGDVLYLPPMWWHQVEGLAPVNLMINYWWRSTPAYHGDPIYALFHALLALRDLPADEKKAWQGLFDHYVFDDPSDGRFEHIPKPARGRLNPVDPVHARQIRAQLLNALNR